MAKAPLAGAKSLLAIVAALLVHRSVQEIQKPATAATYMPLGKA